MHDGRRWASDRPEVAERLGRLLSGEEKTVEATHKAVIRDLTEQLNQHKHELVRTKMQRVEYSAEVPGGQPVPLTFLGNVPGVEKLRITSTGANWLEDWE